MWKVIVGCGSCYSRCHKGPLVWCSSYRLLRMSTLYSVAGSSSVPIVQLWSTILPANLCTLSSLAMSCFWWGSCTAEQYSSLGRIVVWTIFWRTSTGAWWSCWWTTVFWPCLTDVGDVLRPGQVWRQGDSKILDGLCIYLQGLLCCVSQRSNIWMYMNEIQDKKINTVSNRKILHLIGWTSNWTRIGWKMNKCSTSPSINWSACGNQTINT